MTPGRTEPPDASELKLKTQEEEPEESARKVREDLEELGRLEPVREVYWG